MRARLFHKTELMETKFFPKARPIKVGLGHITQNCGFFFNILERFFRPVKFEFIMRGDVRKNYL